MIMTNSKLSEIELTLSPRERDILKTLMTLKFMKTDQIKRLFFLGVKTDHAAAIHARRTLNRLLDKGLVSHLERRVGGARSGSQGLIWFATEAGQRLLTLGKEDEHKRKRIREPSQVHLRHILAVAECYTQIVMLCRDDKKVSNEIVDDVKTSGTKTGNNEIKITLKKLLVEPACWKSFSSSGKTVVLKPDLLAETAAGGYRYYWFIEMDLATEDKNKIMEKTARYYEYYQSGEEQKENGVFPVVLWIVPDEKRRDLVREGILAQTKKSGVKFSAVITPEELEHILISGVKREEAC